MTQRWVRFFPWLALTGAVAFAGPDARRESAVNEKAASAPSDATGVKHPRAVSPHLAAALAEKMPKFAPEAAAHAAPKAPGQAEAEAEVPGDQPANGIVRLPRYVVREEKPPSDRDVRSPRGLEAHAMDKYMGAPGGFSRGVLNRFTFGQAWDRWIKGRVPILGRFDWEVTQENEAMKRYYDDEFRKELRGLVDFDVGAQTLSSRKGRARDDKSEPSTDKSTEGKKADGTH
ncbi:hypothetical protein K0B96_12130 [Horticoccus luteus]|uniref:Uncharacterized protein n=1 Tax=Horticoccus luteus TaxID=2862869 RepID=A0A8F9XGB8_9BACT|nr:hypothetical protein [Horticoccus luteus]QYM78055.1 hypothetical protein K0B96_12130 [Horticoccus luteus]